MSMEQAILEHAGALRELAAAIKSMSRDGGVRLPVEVEMHTTFVKSDGKEAPAEEIHVKSTGKGSERIKAEMVDEVKKDKPAADKAAPAAVEKPATEEVAADMQDQKDAELEAAVTKVEEESKALDYKTDVRPVLLALAKKNGQTALKDLLTKYGAATGDKLTADQFARIVADANALIAG